MKGKKLPAMLRLTLMMLGVVVSMILVQAQPGQTAESILKSLSVGPVPLDLLATKTIALYDPAFTSKELEQIQSGFERTGVDAVVYYPFDLPTCSADVQKVFSEYLVKREIKYLAFLKKNTDGIAFTFTEFIKAKELIKPGQPAWTITGKNIQEVSLDIYRTALNSQKRVNMLVSPLPELDLMLRFLKGTRGEYFAVDLKIDKLAIIKFGNLELDSALENIFKAHYPFKYQLFEPGTDEAEIRNKGFLYMLSLIHTRSYAAMELLDYNMSKAGSVIASVSYPNGQMQLKTIAADEPVYKFYFKQLQNGNVYLGTKWDADSDWQQALLNQIKGLKAELRMN